jgi:hypothetical protein
MKRLLAGVAAFAAFGGLVALAPSAGAEPLTPQACDVNYHPCLPPPPPDLDCKDIGHKVWRVGPDDPHGLDADHDGIGCESYPDISGPPPVAPTPSEPAPPSLPPAPPAPIPYRCVVVDTSEPAVTTTPSLSASRFVPLASPTRVFDTRLDGDDGYVCPGQTITKTIGGHAGVPVDAQAVVLNVTGVLAGGEGFVTVYPNGTARPNASSLNFTSPVQQRPNLVIVPLGTNGQVNFYSQGGAHLIADVAGYFEPVVSSSSGRLVPLAPERILDTRIGIGAAAAKPGAGQSIDLQVTGRAGVPASGVAAVVLNLTGADATSGGFVTAWPTGQPMPNASNLNLVAAGDTAPNLAIVPVGSGGRVSLYTEAGTHLIADVFGYFTDGTAPSSSDGLFVPLVPGRVFDTRPAGFVPAGGSIAPGHLGVAGIPTTNVAAVALNVTATEVAAPGFVTAWPAGGPRPNVSSLNLTRTFDTRPNAAIAPVGTGGAISYFSETGTHLIADTTGYFTGTATTSSDPEPGPPPPQQPAPPQAPEARILIHQQGGPHRVNQPVSIQSLANVGVTTWEWDFGDATTGTGSAATHTYLRTGCYTVRLRVSGPGGSALATQSLCVEPGLPGTGPTPQPWASPNELGTIGIYYSLPARQTPSGQVEVVDGGSPILRVEFEVTQTTATQIKSELDPPKQPCICNFWFTGLYVGQATTVRVRYCNAVGCGDWGQSSVSILLPIALPT